MFCMQSGSDEIFFCVIYRKKCMGYLKLASTLLKENGGRSNPCFRAVIDVILFAFQPFLFFRSTVALIQRLYFSGVFTYLRRLSLFCFERTTSLFQPL